MARRFESIRAVGRVASILSISKVCMCCGLFYVLMLSVLFHQCVLDVRTRKVEFDASLAGRNSYLRRCYFHQGTHQAQRYMLGGQIHETWQRMF